MILDERRKNVNSLMVGMADIQLAYNALASEVIVIYNELSIDHYQDSIPAEVERFKKLSIFRKVEDMNFVPQGDFPELVEDNDNIPYEVLMTETGLPRIPRKDDQILSNGVLYAVHHVKPFNRDYKGLWSIVVYPERTTKVDVLHIYKATLLSTKTLLPITDLDEYMNEVDEEPQEEPQPPLGLGAENDGDNIEPIEKDVVVDFVWGGNPELISLDKRNTWIPFKSRIKMTMTTENLHPLVFIKGGFEEIQCKI